MQCERITLAGDPAALASELRSLVPATESVGGVVAEIIARVRAGGDDAVRFYTRQFDTGGTQPAAVEIPEPELETAAARLPTEIRDALQQEADHVRRVAEAALGSEQAVGFDGHTVTLREVPVGSAAVYVPGGRSPYPSTVVMGVVTARAAGVERVSVCSPPSSNGDIDPVVLAACQLAGASAVFRM
ncbi:MAG: histidinol dehydrogenase, partial [Solirubrobacterales bacterium]|nr:histidinol dehydrogenase [Solirubrobacterales bacterium]